VFFYIYRGPYLRLALNSPVRPHTGFVTQTDFTLNMLLNILVGRCDKHMFSSFAGITLYSKKENIVLHSLVVFKGKFTRK